MSKNETQPIGGEICIVSSCGGHLTEVRCLLPAYQDLAHFYVLNQAVMLPADMDGRTLVISHSERDWRTIVNLWEAYQILSRTRPKVILSTGAGPVVPFALIGRLLFGTHIIFIETITRVQNPSLTGRIMYWLAHDFFYQWRGLKRHFPKGQFGGPLL